MQPAARVIPALLVTTAFGVFGLLSRGVTLTGAAAGTIVAFLIYVAIGLGGFVTLFGVFAITWLTTRIGYRQKRQLGLAEDKSGRNAGQVFANVGAAALFALLALRFGELFVIAAVAALAEAAADTSSSEIGEFASRRAWLITSLRPVAPGTNGAVSLPGTLAALFAALLIAFVAHAAHITDAWITIAIAGFLGSVLDSLLGATVERAGFIGNNTVNATCTFMAGIIAVILQPLY